MSVPLRDQGSPQHREVGVQHSGNWQRKRPEEGGGWETLYDENGYPYFYSHYTQEQTYELPQGVVAPAGYDPSYFPTYAADDNYHRGGEYNSYEQQSWNDDGSYQQLQAANRHAEAVEVRSWQNQMAAMCGLAEHRMRATKTTIWDLIVGLPAWIASMKCNHELSRA